MLLSDFPDGIDQLLHLLHRADGDSVIVPDPIFSEMPNQNAPFFQFPVQCFSADPVCLGKEEICQGRDHLKIQFFQILRCELSVALKLVNTYINIIKSDRVLEKVVEKTGTSIAPANLRRMISAESLNETEMFRVTVTGEDPKLSADIANAIAEVAPAEISQIIQGSSAEIVDHAKVPQTRSGPSYTTSCALGFVGGALLVVIIIFLAYALDVRVKSEEDLAGICSVPVLGTIPDVLEIVKKTQKQRK